MTDWLHLDYGALASLCAREPRFYGVLGLAAIPVVIMTLPLSQSLATCLLTLFAVGALSF